jgi:hypothetical protein
MTTAVKEKKPFLPQRKPQVKAGGALALPGTTPRSAGFVVPLTIGGEPRVHLLPAEVIGRRKVKLLKRRLLIAGGLVVVIVGAGYGLATYTLATSQSQLAAAQSATAALVTQQATYGAVTKVNSDIDSIVQSQKTATAQEILWAPYLQSIEATLPGDGSITAFSAGLDAPFGGVPSSATSATPLQGPRIATITLTVNMVQSEIPAWLNTLPSLKGFVDATPNSVTAGAPGSYVLEATIHINSDAVSGRFAKAGGTTK